MDGTEALTKDRKSAAGPYDDAAVRRDGRTSFWTRTFDLARVSGEWVMVGRLYTQSTAAQLASDIINAGHRDPATVRVKGIHSGERWDARWETAAHGPLGDHVVWIRRLPD